MHDLQTRPSLLLRLSRGVDPEAWQEFRDRYAGLIRRVLAERGVQASERDDIEQEVLLSLVKAMPRFEYDPSRGQFRSYLKTIVVRALARRHRRRTGPAMLGLELDLVEPADESFDAIWDRQWRRYHLRRAWSRLESEFSDLDRSVFEAYAIQGVRARSVGEAHGIAVDRVYRIKSEMLSRLTGLIAEQVEEEG